MIKCKVTFTFYDDPARKVKPALQAATVERIFWLSEADRYLLLFIFADDRLDKTRPVPLADLIYKLSAS